MDDRPACYFYKRGWCRYGTRCRYRHDNSPAVSPPPIPLFVPERPSSAPTQPSKKPEPRASGLARSAGTPPPLAAIPATQALPVVAPPALAAIPATQALPVVAPPAAENTPPAEGSHSSEYSIFGGPDHFAPLIAAIHSVARMNQEVAAPVPVRPGPTTAQIEASASAGRGKRPVSPLLVRFPRAPDDIPPEGRSYMLSQMKMRVVALVHERKGGRAVIELSECLAAWGFADQNKIENLCICAAICEAHEFIREVLALS